MRGSWEASPHTLTIQKNNLIVSSGKFPLICNCILPADNIVCVLTSENKNLINKASELFELFIKEETKKLAGVEMPHMPTLGNAYEEITKQGIDKDFAIPKGLDLKMVSGFARFQDGELSPEIDCMLVHGKGEKYGLTEKNIYDIESVLCIFEVKKTLRKRDFLKAIDHHASIRRKTSKHFEHKLVHEGYEPDISRARKSFSQITGRVAPEYYSGIGSLSEIDQNLFYCLVQESFAPVYIIHGYEGYTEHGLRNSFIDIIEENKTKLGMGVLNIPSLVTSSQSCLVKANGLPYMLKYKKKKNSEWSVVFSTRHNSARIILELIWIKISSFFDVRMPWNDGLYIENAAPLLIAKARIGGWEYCSKELKKSLKREDNELWKPQFITEAELSVVNFIVIRGGYLLLEDGINEYLKNKYDVTIDEVSSKLISTGLFMMDGGYLRPIDTVIYTLELEDDTGYISSEKSRFDLWCKENGIPPRYMTLLHLD
ncbi:MAG: hypothetical protein ACI9D5_001059 [Candidatus Endobugula sp.]|jgi:hypothetical protein